MLAIDRRGFAANFGAGRKAPGQVATAGGGNVTVNSTGNIPSNSVRQFEVRFTSTAAVTFDGQTSTST